MLCFYSFTMVSRHPYQLSSKESFKLKAIVRPYNNLPTTKFPATVWDASVFFPIVNTIIKSIFIKASLRAFLDLYSDKELALSWGQKISNNFYC